MFNKLKLSLLSADWWKKHWYKLVIVFLVILTWSLMSKRHNKLGKFVLKVEEIKKDSRDKILELEIKESKEKLKLEEEKKEKQRLVKEKAEAELEAAVERIKAKNELLKNDSESINKALNDMFDVGSD